MSAVAVLKIDHGEEFTPMIRALRGSTRLGYVIQSTECLFFGQYCDDVEYR